MIRQRQIDDQLTVLEDRVAGRVVVRPWLQDFGYPAQRVRAQIDVAEEMGLGWMLWNATAEVTVGALESE